MRLDMALGISMCLLLVAQLDCSSSNNGRKADGAPGDGLSPYQDTSGPDASDGPTESGRDTSIDSASAGFEVGPEAAVDLSTTDDIDLPAPAIDVGMDGQAIDQMLPSSLDGGDGASGESRPNPCASCAANQVCVQLNDGICSKVTGLNVGCRTISDACRTKLANSGSKSCSSLSECESELCPLPNYRCVYASPCGNEIPEAQVYCYGA